MTVNDFGTIINVNIRSGWILLFILEKLSLLEVMQTQFGSGTNYFKRKKKCIGGCEGAVPERKGTARAKRNPMHSYGSKFFC